MSQNKSPKHDSQNQPPQQPESPKQDSRWPEDWLDKVIVEQWQIRAINDGFVEVPNTRIVQTYYPEHYEKMLKDRFFEDCSMKHEVVHDPRSK